MTGSSGRQRRRLVVTVLVAVAAALVDRIPLPGVERAARYASLSHEGPTLGPFMLGLGPVLSAFLVIEVLAVLVPRWRPLRHGGYEERGRLWARTKVLAVVFSALQAFFVA